MTPQLVATGVLVPGGLAAAPASDSAAVPAGRDRTADNRLAAEVKALVGRGAVAEAHERFSALVLYHQRRASRIAHHYLGDAAEADEAVQDAFVKVFSHIGSYREELPFEVWFTRILINGCLDRRKATGRRQRWLTPMDEAGIEIRPAASLSAGPSPEARLLARERQREISRAIDRLPGRQRTVFILCHLNDCSPREISQLTGLKESTVRVHLFRAVRKLRKLLGGLP
ncbi:MAG TPA: sigma-70 family RNA polymerase sigma factor [Vicinamibacterales bacterium]|nr:sigma-70 family RNA polymerase sigma factor [Vicinamibacterales bacterium]